MRVFLALALAAAVFAGGAYSVARSVKLPAADGTHTSYTSGAATRLDWQDKHNVGFDE